MTTPTMTPAGWYTDPSLRHEYRYWDGRGWTPHVSDRGLTATDPKLRPATNPAGAPTAHPLSTPAPVFAAPAWPEPASRRPTIATHSAPIPRGLHEPSQEQPALSRPTSAPAAARAGRRRWIVPVVAIVAVLAVLTVIAGLVIWAPRGSEVPAIPDAVHEQARTSTSVLIEWAPSPTGPTVDRYLILRDGAEIGSVPGTVTVLPGQGALPRHCVRVSRGGGVGRCPFRPVLRPPGQDPPSTHLRLFAGLSAVDQEVVDSLIDSALLYRTQSAAYRRNVLVQLSTLGRRKLARLGLIGLGDNRSHQPHTDRTPEITAALAAV